jgi:hypothetical protein
MTFAVFEDFYAKPVFAYRNRWPINASDRKESRRAAWQAA